MATTLYSNDFESATVGSGLPEWTNVSGTWVVSTTDPVNGTNAYRNTGTTDGQVVLLSGTGSPGVVADNVDIYGQVIRPGASSAYAMACPLARSNSAATQNYLYLITGTVGGTMSVQLLAKVPGVNSGAYVNKGTIVLTGVSFAAGTKVYIKHREIGTSFAFKIWDASGSEPASFQAQWTDATIAAAGYVGRYQSTNGSTTVSTGFDVVTETTATTAFTAAASGIRICAPNVLASGVATGISSGRFCDFVVKESDVIQLNFDLSNSPAVYGQYRIDDGAIQPFSSLSTSVNLALPYTGAKGQTHQVRVWFNVYESTTGLWSSATGGWKFTGVTLADGGSIVAPTGTRYIEFLGDSITASVRRNYTGVESSAAAQLAIMSSADHWCEMVANSLGMIPVTRGFGAVGLAQAGNGGVPKAIDNFPYVYATNAYTPPVQPDLVVVHHGTNGTPTQADYQAYYTAVRAARPNARILFIAPPGYNRYATIVAAIAAVGSTDTKVSVYDIGAFMSALGGEDFTDTIGHVSASGDQNMRQLIVSYLQPLLEADRIPPANKVAPGYSYNYTQTGTLPLASVNNVIFGIDRGDGVLGNYAKPPVNSVLEGQFFGANSLDQGRYRVPSNAFYLQDGPGYGVIGALTTGDAFTPPDASYVLTTGSYRKNGTTTQGTASQSGGGGTTPSRSIIGIS